MHRCFCAGALVALCGLCAVGHGQILGPSPYLSFADSPFASTDFSGGYFFLENFEDGALNTPGVTATSPFHFVNGPAPTTDSVDGDDVLGIDGSGQLGHSYYSGGEFTFEFVFDSNVLGKFPTHVGIVWTDVGEVSGEQFGLGDVTFEAVDSFGMSVGDVTAHLGDGSILGQTAEDRFFGVIDNDGISSITITMLTSSDWEIDHLQYGSVPEPAGMVGLALGLGFLVRRR